MNVYGAGWGGEGAGRAVGFHASGGLMGLRHINPPLDARGRHSRIPPSRSCEPCPSEPRTPARIAGARPFEEGNARPVAGACAHL